MNKVSKAVDLFDQKTILITGGTGSLGSKFVPMTLEKFSPKKLIIFSAEKIFIILEFYFLKT